MDLATKSKSVVELNNLYFDRIEFWRTDSLIGEEELGVTFQRKYEFSENRTACKVMLKCLIHDREEKKLHLEMGIVGVFSCYEAPTEHRETLLTKNTLAILFPYLRSQVSIVTAQPNLTPIILPPMNIDAMFDGTE